MQIVQYTRLMYLTPGLHYNLAKGQIDHAAIAQLGERQTEDLKVPGSIPGRGKLLLNRLRIHCVTSPPDDNVNT